MHRPLRALELVQPGQRCAERFAIEEKQRRQRLVLRRGCHVPLPRQMIQKRRDLICAKRRRMSFSGEIDKPLDPMNVRFLRALAVVESPNSLTHAVE